MGNNLLNEFVITVIHILAGFNVSVVHLENILLIHIFHLGTKFGAMLDQLTDRCGTMCLMVTLSLFYPKYMFFFQLSMTIDIACHWMHLHT